MHQAKSSYHIGILYIKNANRVEWEKEFSESMRKRRDCRHDPWLTLADSYDIFTHRNLSLHRWNFPPLLNLLKRRRKVKDTFFSKWKWNFTIFKGVNWKLCFERLLAYYVQGILWTVLDGFYFVRNNSQIEKDESHLNWIGNRYDQINGE